MLMTVHHGVQHLSEQMSCFLLAETLPAPQVCVHVTMVTGQEDVHAALLDHHVQQGADVVMATDPGIGSQTLLVTTQREHL